MPSLPGLDCDIYFGSPDQPLPDWRQTLPDDASDDDELTPAERQAIVALIGFDPADDC